MKKWIKKYFALDTRALQELSGEALAERLFRQRTIVFFIDAIENIFNTIKAPRLYGFSKAQERLKANSHTELKYQLRKTLMTPAGLTPPRPIFSGTSKPLDSGQLIEKLKLYASRKQV
ncbi:MAG: hypothetical protein ACLR2E_13245 [Lachnospiraceae bacterium]